MQMYSLFSLGICDQIDLFMVFLSYSHDLARVSNNAQLPHFSVTIRRLKQPVVCKSGYIKIIRHHKSPCQQTFINADP